MVVRDTLNSLVSRISKTAKTAQPKVAKIARRARASAATTFVTKPLQAATKVTRGTKVGAATKSTKSATATKAAKATKASKAVKVGTPVGKRTRIDTTPSTAGGSRYVRRDAAGHFTEDQVSVGKSLAADRRTKAKTKATKGNKDRGD